MRAGNFRRGLIRLDLNNILVLVDGFALGNQDVQNVGQLDAVTQIGEFDVN